MSEQISMDAVLDAVRGDLMVRQTVIAGTSYVSVEAILGVLRRHGWDRPDAPVTAGATVTREQVEAGLWAWIESATEGVTRENVNPRVLDLNRPRMVEAFRAAGLTVVDGPTGEGGA